MLPHHVQNWFTQYFMILILFYRFPVCHRDPGTPVPLLMTRRKSDLLKFMVWPYLTIPMSAWPLCHILPKRKWRVIIHNIFRHLSLLPELTHRQNFVPAYAVRGFKHHADVSPCGQNRNLFVFSNLSGKDVVITNLFQCTCPRMWLNSPNELHWQQLQKDTSACLFLKLMMLSAFLSLLLPRPQVSRI